MKKQCGILAILISLFIVSPGCKKTDEVKTGALQVSVVNQSSLPIRDAMVTLTGFSQVQYSSSEGLVLFSGYPKMHLISTAPKTSCRSSSRILEQEL